MRSKHTYTARACEYAGPAPAVAEAQREGRRIREGEDRDQEGEVQTEIILSDGLG